MLERFRPRLSYGNVMATIAVFLALGGGYAVAFSGSGTLQKGAEVNISSSLHDVRTLTGIGAIGVECDSTHLLVYMRNNSGHTLNVAGVGTDGTVSDQVFATNVYRQIMEGSQTQNNVGLDLHISRVDGNKRPQADVHITAYETGDCSTSSLSVLALNTEE